MKTHTNFKKHNSNFWDNAPKITEKEKQDELNDLGYNPVEQKAKGNERIRD